MQTRWKKGLAALLCVAVLGGGGYMWYAHEQRIQAEASQTLTLSGNVDVREVSVAFRQSDRIAEILADEGDTVQAGQVLARLDDHELQLQRAKADAQVRAQQNTVDKLHNGTRQEEIAQAQAQYEAAQLAYVLSQYELRAPADGVIRSRLLQPGDMASPSAPIQDAKV